MRKVVALFKKNEDAFSAGGTLTSLDMADYSITKLSSDYEQQLRQEVFLRPEELRNMVIGALLGMVALGILFALLSNQSNAGILLARLMAGGLPAATFVGAGIGLALGALLSGVYSLSVPLDRDFKGYWMMTLYTLGQNQQKKGREIIQSNFGIFV